jgi:hypothetical protein
MARFDVGKLLDRLAAWCAKQDISARLVEDKPLTDTAIDRIPRALAKFALPLPTPYDPARFVIPDGYRALLRRCGGVRIEIEPDGEWETWPVFDIFRPPGDCARAHLGARHTLCDSWTVEGTTVDDRAITTTELVSFATAGFAVEASRWCFHLGGKPGKPPAIYEESNDYECLIGRFVDTGEWISDFDKPVFASFEAWLNAVVGEIVARPLDPDDNDALVNAICARGRT